MSKLISLLFSIFLIILLVGCDSSDNGVESTPANIAGNWTGYLVMDEFGSESSMSSSFSLRISQSNDQITATLIVPANISTDSVVTLSGSINGDLFELTSTTHNNSIMVNGYNESKTIIQLSVSGFNDSTYIIGLHKTELLMDETPLTNKNKIELKMGSVGIGRSVILIHGMLSDATTWNEMLDYFKRNGLSDSVNVWVFEYKWWDHIKNNGTYLYNTITSMYYHDSLSQDPIIIAHSMGGLVARSCVEQGGNLHKLVTLGTPHMGSDLAKITYFNALTSYNGVTDLAPGSGFLNELNSSNLEKSERHNYTVLNGSVGTYFYCYKTVFHHCVVPGYKWESPEPSDAIKMGYAGLSKPNDGMVPESSARFDSDQNVQRIDASTFQWIDHIHLTQDSRTCSWVKNFINKNR